MPQFKMCLNSGTINPADATRCSVCGWDKFKDIIKEETSAPVKEDEVECWNCSKRISPDKSHCPECRAEQKKTGKVILLQNTNDGQQTIFIKYKDK